MPLTPEQIAKIRRKETETPDALKRNPLNDYTEGWFHVTLNVRDEAPVLGYLTGNPDVDDGGENAPRCVLTALGRKVEAEWRGIGRYYPSCICEEIQVMPEHLHALLHLLPDNRGHLGRIINGLMIGCTHAYWDTLGIPWREMREQIDYTLKRFIHTNKADAAAAKAQSKALRAEWQDKDHTRSFRGPALMVRGYNDVEALTEEEIDIKRRYIRDNPRKRLITCSRPDRFRVMRNQCSRSWTLARALHAIAADPWIGRNPERCRQLQDNVSQRLRKRLSPDSEGATDTRICGDSSTLVIDYVGNRALLAAVRKVPLICHRADAALFEQQRDAVIQAAREGAVVVSAFVSPKERDIMQQLMTEQLPFIELMDNGFSDRYKPIGKAFYSTAENRHVQMTCWNYAYQPELKDDATVTKDSLWQKSSSISREMCLVMNELARVITGVEDDWWKSPSALNKS